MMSNQLLHPFKRNNTWGYVNPSGEVVIECKYSFAGKFKEKLALVRLGNKDGLIRLDGSYAIAPEYDEIDYLEAREIEECKFLKVKQNGRFGLIDLNGNKILGISYDDIKLIDEQWYGLKLEKLWAIANHETQKNFCFSIYKSWLFNKQ